MTMNFVVLDPTTGQVWFINAGHTHPLLWKDQKMTVTQLIGAGSILGSQQRVTTATHPVSRSQLEKGDCFFLYTDGLTENKGVGGKLSRRELRSFLTNVGDVKERRDALVSKLQTAWGEIVPADDCAFLFVKWTGTGL